MALLHAEDFANNDSGASYEDRGMRHDQHDFVGVTVDVPIIRSIEVDLVSPVDGDENNDASQPAASDLEQYSSTESGDSCEYLGSMQQQSRRRAPLRSRGITCTG